MRKILYLLVVFVALVSAWLAFKSQPQPEAGVSGETKAVSGNPAIGGHFSLTDQNGKAVTDADFAGKYMLVFFGFTNCPDVCPTALLTISHVLSGLGEQGKDIVPIFVSVDPERDTVEKIKQYAANFSDRIVALTGTSEQVAQATEAYKVYHAKVEDKTGAAPYAVDHSGFIYLMGKDGKYIKHFSYDIAEEQLLQGIKQVLTAAGENPVAEAAPAATNAPAAPAPASETPAAADTSGAARP